MSGASVDSECSGDDERSIKFTKTPKFSPRDSWEGQSVASENEQKSQADGELATNLGHPGISEEDGSAR